MKILKNFFKKYLDSPDTPLSEADELLQQFDKDHPGKSASQLREMAKAKRISELRD
jgi:hypothetical protein